MMEPMQTPTTRAEFERRFHLLREQIRKGKFFVARGMTAGIDKVRFLPNRRIDFLSVNESARLQANMMSQVQSEAFKEMLKTRGAQGAPQDSAPEHSGETPAE
jgi:hypothetical protein